MHKYLPTWMCVCHMYAWGIWRPEEAVRHTGTGITDNSDVPRGFWELSANPLQEQ